MIFVAFVAAVDFNLSITIPSVATSTFQGAFYRLIPKLKAVIMHEDLVEVEFFPIANRSE